MEAHVNPSVYDRTRAAVRYDEMAHMLVHRFGYGERLVLAPLIGRSKTEGAQNVQSAFEVEQKAVVGDKRGSDRRCIHLPHHCRYLRAHVAWGFHRPRRPSGILPGCCAAARSHITIVTEQHPERAMLPVEIYTTRYCPYCLTAKALLARKGVPFTEIDLTSSRERFEEMIERAHGRATVPQIFIGSLHVGGSDELHALERAGELDALLAGKEQPA